MLPYDGRGGQLNPNQRDWLNRREHSRNAGQTPEDVYQARSQETSVALHQLH